MVYEPDLIEQLKRENETLRAEVDALKQQQADYQQLQTALHDRESEVKALLGVPPHPVIARFDPQLRHIYVNAAVKLATGIPPEDYIGKTSREMGLPENVLMIWENALLEVFRKGLEKSIEYSVEVDNQKWTYQSRIVPEFIRPSVVGSVLAVTRNITRQKRAEVALLENYEILETIHRVGLALSGVMDAQRLIQTVTDAGTQLTGADFGAFILNQLDESGQRYVVSSSSNMSREVFMRVPMARTTEIFGRTLRDCQKVRVDDLRKDLQLEQTIPAYDMPDGYRPVRSYLALPVISHDGEVIGGLCFGHGDASMFTERHERIIEGLAAQAAIALDNARLFREMREQQEHLRTTLASIGDAVIATDAQGKITFINPVALSLTGWTEQDALDQPLAEVFKIISEDTGETVESPVDKVVREGTIVGLANHTLLVRRDGHVMPIDDSGAPIYDDQQNLLGVILVFRDISERKRSEQRINLLLELTSAFSQALTAQEIAEVVVDRALKALGGNLGTVTQLVENNTMLEMLNLRGLPEATVEKYRRTPLDLPGPLNDAVRENKIIWLETFEQYVTLYPQFEEAIRNNGSRSSVCIPLEVNGRVIGGFNLSFPTEKPRNPADETFFIALAQQCAQSLERARLSGFGG